MQRKETAEEQLHREIDTGIKAGKFYDQFVKAFVEEKRQLIFEAFEASLPNDTEALSELRRMLSTINRFDVEIKAFIETGQMAQISIKDQEKH